MGALCQLSYVGVAPRMVPLWLPWLLTALVQGGVPFAHPRRGLLVST
jgi:hypothetical protein